MAEKTFLSQNDKGKEEEKKSLMREEKPLRLEPGEVKSVLEDIPPTIEPKKPTEISPKETLEKKEEKTVVSPMPAQVKRKERKTVVSPIPAQAKIGPSPKTEGKSSPFFSFLFILSFVFMAITLGLLLLPLLNISIPPFLNSVINLVSSK